MRPRTATKAPATRGATPGAPASHTVAAPQPQAVARVLLQLFSSGLIRPATAEKDENRNLESGDSSKSASLAPWLFPCVPVCLFLLSASCGCWFAEDGAKSNMQVPP